MLSLVHSTTLVGIDAVPVSVECSISQGQLPTLSIVGLPSSAVKEGAVRVKSALAAVGHEVPQQRVTVNLAPADLRKPGSALDLPTALSIMFAAETFDNAVFSDLIILGELGLDGSVRRVPGVLAAAMLARDRGMRGVIVPAASAAEALVVDEIEVYGVSHLREVTQALAGERDLPVPRARTRKPPASRIAMPDMADVRDQPFAREAIEIAVAGGHNLLLVGPPGAGKTMLACRIPTVLPAMTRDESLETTKIFSALGLADGLVEQRPFRAPHHSISGAALLGGGTHPRPGEISLAHNGVLFLDELPEFQRGPIESLRQPLEERTITIARAHGTLKLPASFLLVAAANPCPCGWRGSGVRECTCGPGALARYQSRLSGPLLDRIDLQVQVGPVEVTKLRNPDPSESSAAMRDRVTAARDRQRARLAPYNIRCNAEMSSRVMRETCPLDAECEATLVALVARTRWLSARSIDRIIKVARTCADLDDLPDITPGHLDEAAGFRTIDPLADTDTGNDSKGSRLPRAFRQAAAAFRENGSNSDPPSRDSACTALTFTTAPSPERTTQ